MSTMAAPSEPARIAHFLSLDTPPGFNEVALARCVAQGLPVRATQGFVQFFGTSRIVNQIIPEASLRRARKEKRRLSALHSERLYDLGKVIDAAKRAYGGDDSAVKEFLTRSHVLLDGSSPLALAVSGAAGADAVLKLLARAEAGVAV